MRLAFLLLVTFMAAIAVDAQDNTRKWDNAPFSWSKSTETKFGQISNFPGIKEIKIKAGMHPQDYNQSVAVSLFWTSESGAKGSQRIFQGRTINALPDIIVRGDMVAVEVFYFPSSEGADDPMPITAAFKFNKTANKFERINMDAYQSLEGTRVEFDE